MDVKTKSLSKQVSETDGTEADAVRGKGIELLVRKTASGDLAGSVELEADENLLEVLNQDKVQEQDKVRNDKAQGQDSNPHSDSAELSNESLIYSRGEEDALSRQKELELLLNELWTLLEGWQSIPGSGLLQEVNQLKDIYQQLLQEIMRLCTQAQAGTQADRINSLLLEIIDKMGDSKFPNLLFLFEKYGEEGAEDFLRGSVFRSITGKTVSPQEMAAAREQRGHDGKQMEQSPRTGQRTAAGGSAWDEGILYYRGKGNKVDTNQRYRESVQSVEQFHLGSGGKGGKVKFGAGFRGLQEKSCSPADIERSERFLTYISNQGNLYGNPGITAGNEELLGFLMAVSMAKVQIFTEYSGVGKGLALDVQRAVEQLFRHYLVRAMDTGRRQAVPSGGSPALDGKAVRRMYYQVMELIQRFKAPGKGIERGLLYAWEVFTAKKDREEYKKLKRYQPGAGFFTDGMAEKDKLKDVIYGIGILDKDWRDFLSSVGQNHNTFLQLMLSKSPWGMLLEPEKGSGSKRESQAFLGLLIGTGVCMLVVLAGVFICRLIF